MLVSVDSGKENTKLFTHSKQEIFKTRVARDEEIIRGLEGKTYGMFIDGNLYKVGEGVSTPSYDVSKFSEIHKVSILTALALVPTEEPFKLVTGTPISLFFSEERELLQNSLLGTYSIILNDRIYKKIEIVKSLVVAESMGVIYNNYSYYKDRLVKVVDIGGLNTNGSVYRNGKPLRESIITVNEGVNILVAKVRKALNREGCNYQTYEVEQLLEKGEGTEIEKAIIHECVLSHLSNIKKDLKASNWNISIGDLVFTGGGSKLLELYIKEVFPNAVVTEEPIWDNCKGFYKIGGSLL